MLIVCEGENTEPQYFKQFALHHKNSRVKVKLADRTGVPFSLVRAAKEYKNEAARAAKREHDENIAFDSVWCVFDIDEHPHVHEARNMANANGINLAISNPCFELWLLLHLRDSPGMQHRHAMQAMMKDFIKDYDKNVNFKHYAQDYERAVERAKKLDTLAAQVGEPGRNPTTNVYELTESILKDEVVEEPEPEPAPCPEGVEAAANAEPAAGPGNNTEIL